MAELTLTVHFDTTNKGTTKLQLVATGDGITSKVFAIEQLPTSADPPEPIYRFSHVCSVAELTEFPEEPTELSTEEKVALQQALANQPELLQKISVNTAVESSYFRTNDITMIFDTMKYAQQVMECIQSDIDGLLQEYNLIQDTPVEGSTVTLPSTTARPNQPIIDLVQEQVNIALHREKVVINPMN